MDNRAGQAEVETGANKVYPRPSLPQISWVRHLLVISVMALSCVPMYMCATGAAFQFDDEPNITKNTAIMMETVDFPSLKKAIIESLAKNRILVNLSCAFQYWGAQFIPRLIDNEPPRPDLIEWQFRMFNYVVHMLAGYSVYFVFLWLFSMPVLKGRYAGREWSLAFLASMVWFCSPLQTQSVTYIVQRATSMATLFYMCALLTYFKYRASNTPRGKLLYIALTALSFACAMTSKEIAATFPLAILAIEYMFYPKSRREFIRQIGVICGVFGVIFIAGCIWIYGRSINLTETKYKPGELISVNRAAHKTWEELVGKVLADKPTSQKVPISPRQRFLTETRVIAMYESLLLGPAPWRLNLDYDFPESLGIELPENAGMLEVYALSLVILLFAIIMWGGKYRFKIVSGLIFTLVLLDVFSGGIGITHPVGFEALWSTTWPVPAMFLHLMLIGVAAFNAFKRPLIAFGIMFFYMGHIIESTVLILEVVFEHRLYLPSVGFYLVFVLIVYECFLPVRPKAVPAEELECA